VYRLNDQTALVQTLDFFTPIVDDAELFGEIAASNALSDVYAMGGRPITAMAIAGMPTDKLSNDDISAIFRGGAQKVVEAQCSLVGGHTIKNPEPIYGLSVTGIVHPDRHLANAHAKPGDILILTKPLGTGIISSAAKVQKADQDLIDKATDCMKTLNTVGADLAEHGLVACCTDVTGFGLLGHLWELCAASNVTAKIHASDIPAIDTKVFDLIDQKLVPGGSRKNLTNIESRCVFGDTVTDAQKLLLADAQTAGGLLIACPPDNLEAVIAMIESSNSICCAVIGSCAEDDNLQIVIE